MILPATAARFWATSIVGLIVVAALIAIFSSVIGLLLSFYYSLPSGPAIILIVGIGYILSLIFGPVGGVIMQALPRQKI